MGHRTSWRWHWWPGRCRRGCTSSSPGPSRRRPWRGGGPGTGRRTGGRRRGGRCRRTGGGGGGGGCGRGGPRWKEGGGGGGVVPLGTRHERAGSRFPAVSFVAALTVAVAVTGNGAL